MTSQMETFLANHVRTVEQLEILLLLHRSPDTYWTAEALAQHLGLAKNIAEARVMELARSGLAKEGASGPQFRFHSADADTVRIVGDIATAYRDKRIAVINAIYAANLTRLKTFSDAFKFGDKKEPQS